MAVRTKELGAQRGATANVAVTLYTCPTGRTAIVKDSKVLMVGACTYTMWILRGGFSHQIARRTVTATTLDALQGLFVVLEPGDVLQMAWTTTDTVHQAWVSGAELDGVA